MEVQGRTRPRWTRGQILTVALALVPFAAAIGFRTAERAPPHVEEAVKRPSLAFDQYFVDLGEIYNLPRAEAFFRFRNQGPSPARITKLEPSCGCLKPRLGRREYAPGEICEFSMSVLTTHQSPGPHEYELAITYEDPQPRTVTVSFKLNLRQSVRVDPSQLIFIQDGSKETQEKVIVTDMRQHPFHILGATCESPLVTAQVNDAVEVPEGGRDIPVLITVAAKVPSEGVDTAVILRTDDRVYPRIPIPLLIRDIHTKKIVPVSHHNLGATPREAGH
jgi:Protein of unknown function (DUF1573)